MVTTGLGTSFPTSLLGPELRPGRSIGMEPAKPKGCPTAVLRMPPPRSLHTLRRGLSNGPEDSRLIKHLFVSQFPRKPRVPMVRHSCHWHTVSQAHLGVCGDAFEARRFSPGVTAVSLSRSCVPQRSAARRPRACWGAGDAPCTCEPGSRGALPGAPLLTDCREPWLLGTSASPRLSLPASRPPAPCAVQHK